MHDDHDLARMEDDGAPAPIQAARLGIRIAPATPPTPTPPRNPTSDWDSYAAWRPTKCRARDLDDQADRLVEIDQATAEFVGECAELAELIYDRGPAAFDEFRAELIGEAGDVLFCGLWALDAWRARPVLGWKDGEVDFNDPAENATELMFRQAILHWDGIAGEDKMLILANICAAAGAVAFTSGLMADAYKKERFQGRPQDALVQRDRVVRVFGILQGLLILAGSSVAEAMARNVEKLDARYPNGPSRGGGIREGKGA